MAASKTKTKKKTTFISRFPDLTMVRVAPDYEYDSRGRIMGTEQPKEGDSPWTIQFDNSNFETDDSTLIEFIRESPQFNTDIWEEGAAPDEPEPTQATQMQAISDAAATRDTEALVKLIKDEKSGHKRTPIVQAAEVVLSTLEGLPTELGGIDDQPVTAAVANEPLDEHQKD